MSGRFLRSLRCDTINMMSKGKLIFIFACGALLVLAVVISAFTLLRAGRGVDRVVDDKPTPTPGSILEMRVPHGGTEAREAETAGSLTVFEAENGLQLVENSGSGFSVSLPETWVIGRSTAGSALKAIFQSSEDSVDGSLEITKDPADGITNASAWVAENFTAARDVTSIYANGFPGVRFSTDFSSEYFNGTTYVSEVTEQAHAVFIKDGALFHIFCEAQGASYVKQGRECDAIITSFSFF